MDKIWACIFWSCMSFCFVFKECEMWNARSIILSGKQGTFNSDVWYSKILIFSFIDVLLNFLKYLRSVLFRKKCFVRSVLVYRLLVTLSYFRPDRFVHFLILTPLLILLLYLLVSIDLAYSGLSVLVLYASLSRTTVFKVLFKLFWCWNDK